ncbi:MAG TPA: DUF2220 family protein [Anaerolineae bacterium]|nr:DUF2220 family protein [Anaerolineae bacterium]
MTAHLCVWRALTEWRPAPEPGGWTVAYEHKLHRCAECGAEKSVRTTGRRHRYRDTQRCDAPVPPALSKMLTTTRFKAVAQVMAALGQNRLEIEPQIQEWLKAGWIEIEETQDVATRAWQVQALRLSPSAAESLIHQPHAARQQQQQDTLATALAGLAGWQMDLATAREYWDDDPQVSALFPRLESLLQAQEQALRQGEWLALPDTRQRPGDAPHRRWLQVLRGLLALLAADHWEYERTFSARWLGDSKQLGRDRQGLEAYLDIHFEHVSLWDHTPIVYCWGAFQAACAGYPLDGRAGVPFVALAAESIGALREIQVSARYVLVIENQTAFETLLRPPLRRDAVLYLFSGGHAGYAERELLCAWLTAAPGLPWYLWTDWDVGGVRIQQDWARWAADRHLAAPVAWLWDQASLARWYAWGHPLTDDQRIQLVALSHPLAESLLQAGYTLEQETVLPELNPMDLELSE